MMPMLLVVTATTMLAVGLTTYAVLDVVFSDDRRVSRRLKDLTEYERVQAGEAEPLLRPFSERVLVPLWSVVQRGVRALWPADYRDRLGRTLVRAGNPNGLDVSRFLVGKLVLALAGGLGVLAVGVLRGGEFGTVAFFALLAAALGFFAPDMWLSGVVHSRQHAIVRDLPDMLDMLTISVEAGLGFDAALSKVVRVSEGPLAREFGRALQEVQAGSSRKEALRQMSVRIDVPELSAFTVAIIQAEMFGISIASVLRSQAAEMRLRRRQRAEEEAQKAPVKMAVPLVLCILPATMIVVGGPAVLRVLVMFG